MKYYFTSESVTKGHPDKICDQISDAILDELLKNDPDSRCACEVTVEKNACHVMGEVSTKASINYGKVVRDTLYEIGYNFQGVAFDYNSCRVDVTLNEQSKDIAKGIESSYDEKSMGAGDQGMMFGYANNETKELMPMALMFARNLTDALTKAREDKVLKYLRPDGKSQITIEYENDIPKRIDTIVVSASHDESVDIETLRKDIREIVILPNLPSSMIDIGTKFYINPTGRFVNCGPSADTGLTGRKIIVDTYGGYAPHGGGAFSGKDCTKVDRTGAYAARNIAKTVVASGVADECEVQVSYAIGLTNPVSICVNTFGSSKIPNELISDWVKKTFDLRPSSIIKEFGLKNPIYKATASNGHFGHEEFPWEVVDKDKELSLLKLSMEYLSK